jgi:thioredoxin 1
MRKRVLPLILTFYGFILSTTFLAVSVAWVSAEPSSPKEIPVKDMVTMIDLGARSCIPCKMMAPILEKLEKDYKGRAAIVFLDVSKDPEQAKRFGIRLIPTQIFFDKQGNEVLRHTGFMSEEAIVTELKKMGVK